MAHRIANILRTPWLVRLINSNSLTVSNCALRDLNLAQDSTETSAIFARPMCTKN